MREDREKETQQWTRDREEVGGALNIEVVEPSPLDSDADIFDSLPDDDDEDLEVISLDDVSSMMEGKKIVGGILRPEDMPLGNQ